MHNLFDKIDVWTSSSDYKYHLVKETQNQLYLSEFLKKFTIPFIQNMDIDDYVIGKENKFAFCPWLEKGLKDYGSISGHTTAYHKYVIYWDKENKQYSFGDKRTKRRKNFGDNKTDIFETIKKRIVDIIVSTKNKDYQEIAENPLNPQFKNKISFLYDSKNQLPIYSNDDLDILLAILNIPYDKRQDRIFKRVKLFDFYCQSGISKILSPYLFMNFLYGNYGYNKILRGDKQPKIDKKAIKYYSLKDIKIQQTIASNTPSINTGAYIYEPAVEEVKRITGAKAEDIVIEYLEKHAKELDVHNLIAWCRDGKQKDDSKGYDISYELSDGTKIMGEIKGTKFDLKHQVCFEMSANELNTMRANPDTYYVFFVNDVNNGKEIKRILAKDIYGEIPTKYRINFTYKDKD